MILSSLTETKFSVKMREMDFTERILRATSKNESLRTTVPRSIIKQFGLTQDDQLEWNLKAEGGELIIQVKPIKEKRD